MHLTDKDGNVYGWGGLEIIGPDGKPKVIDQGLTSVGLSMPSAFTVSNSPLTSNGTIGVTGAGTNLEYIDGTGALRTFPSLSGYVTAVTASAPLSSSGGTTPNITISQATGSTDGYLSATDWNTFNDKQPAGSYITGLSGEASGSGPGIASVTLNNASVTAKILTGVNITGGSINASDSILTAFGKLQNQINGLIGSSIYQGTWNAATNTPALTSGVGTRGYYYIVNVAGSTNLDGITDWNVGDWVIFDGTAWQQVDNTDSVTSVNGQTGAVSLTTDNIPEGAVNQYFTNLRARQALSLTTSGSSGAATYNNGTGVFNIPNYTLSGLGGVPSSRTLTINGTTYDLSADRSWNVGTVTSVDMTVPTGFVISGNPITNSGTLALTFNSDYSLPTIASQLEWDTAYDNMIVSASVTGTTTKTLTLNQQDGGTITTSWTDYDTAPVTSVFGRTGAVVAQSGDYSTSLVTEGSNLYYTDARARAAISLTTTGTSGAATYNIFTGVLNIPQYQSVITNPVTGTGTANYVARWISSSQISTGTLYDNGSNVGIGTVSPSAALHIASSNGITLGAVAGNIGTLQLTTTSQGSPVSGRLLFGTDISGWQFRIARNAGGSVTDLFTIQDDGNVGIGTTTPNTKLDVNGDAYFRSDIRLGYNYSGPSTAIFKWQGGSSDSLGIFTWGDARNIQIGGSNTIFAAEGGSERMRITSAGNVGIGTSSPSAKLHVNGTFISNALWTDNTSVGYWGAYSTAYGYLTWDAGFARIGSMPGNRLDFSTNGSTLAMTIATDGNIGIGTTGPNSLLSATERVLLIENSNLASLYLSSLAGRKWSMSSAGDGALVWWDLNSVAERMRINSSGNVGINTSSPAYKLTVAGRTYVDQFQYNQGIPISNTNLNDWTDAGFYAGSGLGNAPDPYGWYYVTVERHSDASWVHQTATSYGAGNTGNRIYSRVKEAGAWGAWKELADSASISGTTNYVSKFTSSTTIGNSQIFDNGTNVGIGTGSPTEKLSVNGNIALPKSGETFIFNDQSASDSVSIGGASYVSFKTYSGGWFEKMRISTSGNIGVGTTATTELSGYKTITFNDVAGSFTEYRQNGTPLFRIGADYDRPFLYGMTNAPMDFYTNGVERMRIAAGGNVGIGTTNPGAQLDVIGVGHFGRTTGGDIGLGIFSGSGSDYSRIRFYQGTTNIHTIHSFATGWASNNVFSSGGALNISGWNGVTIGGWNDPDAVFVSGGITYFRNSVGIGTTAPTNKLDVIGTSYFSSDMYVGQNRGIFFNGNGGYNVGVYSSGSDFVFQTAGSEKMRLTGAGNLGIGTTYPSGKLDVSGTVITTSTLNSTAGSYAIDHPGINTWKIGVTSTNSSTFHIGNDTGGSFANKLLSITQVGNVGIGITNPSFKLHVVGAAAIGQNTNGTAVIDAYFGNAYYGCNTATNGITINPSGYVGIGTTAPSYRLDVAGDIHVQSSSLVGTVYFGNSGQNYLSYYSTDSYYRANGNHYFEGNGFYKGIWDANGFVGIGTTAPERKLDIVGTHTTSTFRVFYPDLNVAGQNASVDIWASEPGISYNGSGIGSNVNRQPYYGRTNNALGQAFIRFLDGTMMFHTSTGDALYAERVRITASGNVGIGTSNPTYRLHVQDSANIGTIAIGDSTYPGLLYSNSNTGEFRIDNRSSAGAGYITFYPNGQSGVLGNEAMRITTNGNIGIGTVTPSQKLHVEGNVRVTGAYYDSNNQAGTSGQILSSTGSGTDWVDSPIATATSVAQLLPSATVTYNWTGQVIDGTWVNIFSRADNILTTGVWTVTMYVSDFGQGGNHYQYRYSGTMTWYQGGTNQTGLPAASEIALHRMGHAANNCILYLRTTEEAASDGGNGKLQVNANYSNTSNTTITFTFVKII